MPKRVLPASVAAPVLTVPPCKSEMAKIASASKANRSGGPVTGAKRRGAARGLNAWGQPSTPAVEALIAEAIAVIGWLPVLDRNLLRVLALTDDEKSTTADLARAIERDPGLATAVLRYANSEYFGREGREFTVREAVVMVGRIATRRMCLEAITYEFFELAPGNAHFSRGVMYMHSLAVANVAYATALRVRAAADVAHLGGLLHDCGKLIMPYAFDSTALDAIARQFVSGEERSRLEWETFGVDHAQVGAVFAHDSGVDAETAATIAWHHGGTSYAESPTAEAACVQLADIIVNMMTGTESPGPMLDSALEKLKLTYEDIGDLAVAAMPGRTNDEAASLSYHIYRLERDANTDELTGVPNRRCISKTLNDALADEKHGALLLCDVDYFKDINDVLGHGTGDLVLIEVARLLSGYGHVARLGGDEFVIWAPGADGHALAARIVAAASKYYVKGTDWPLSLSVGVADLAASLSATLAAADSALYVHKAKHHKQFDRLRASGRGRRWRGAKKTDVTEPATADQVGDAEEAAARRRTRGFEVREEHRAFEVLVPPPFEVRDADLRSEPAGTS
jgi:diguanylate cyclase (GGDEF)-like protein/putative nucleotidyltransferase with HDIG domain